MARHKREGLTDREQAIVRVALAAQKSGNLFPTIKALAREFRLSEMTLERAVKLLKEDGTIVVANNRVVLEVNA